MRRSRVWLAGLVVAAMGTAACERGVSDTFTISSKDGEAAEAPGREDLIAVANDALVACALREPGRSSDAPSRDWEALSWAPGTVAWSPRPEPQFRLTIDEGEPAAGEVDQVGAERRIALGQERNWPLGRTTEYRCVHEALRQKVGSRFGEARVTYEASDDPFWNAQSGAVVASCLSGALGLLWARTRRARTRWTLALLSPFMVAFALYWVPVLVAGPGDTSEIAVWSPLFILLWGLPAVVVSAVATALIGRRLRRRAGSAPQAGRDA